MVKFTEIIEASLEWTATVLFRPFKPRKWLILILVALMAGYLSGGCHLNLSGGGGHDTEKAKKPNSPQSVGVSTNTVVKKELKQPALPSTPQEIKSYIYEQLKRPFILPLVICVILLLIILFISCVWLSARFAFIFLDNITKNNKS